MSYNGGIDFGLLGDYDAMPDIDVVGERIEASLDELRQGGQGATAGRSARRARSARRRRLVAESELRVLGHLVRGPRRA